MSREEFPAKVKVAAFDRANGRCEVCGARLYVGKYQSTTSYRQPLAGRLRLRTAASRARHATARRRPK